MGSTTPIENALYGLKDFVESNIGTYLAAIEAEKGDGISLPTFAIYDLGYKDPFGQRDYPVICFVPDGVVIEPENQAEDIEIIVDMVFALTSSDPENPMIELTKKQLRYSDALRTLIADDASLGGKVSIADTNGVEFFPADPENPKINLTIIEVKIIIEDIL